MLTVKGVPRAFPACPCAGAVARWGEALVTPDQLGKVPNHCWGSAAAPKAPGPRGCGSSSAKAASAPPSAHGQAAGLEREQPCPEMLLVTMLLPRFSLRHLCAVLLVLLAPSLPSSCTLGSSLFNFSKMKAQRSSPWPGACPCLESPWGKERKCF